MIRTLAIDDEPLALQLVEGYIRRTPFLKLCGLYDNPLTAMEHFEGKGVDLIFLDIQMPDLNGTEFARTITNKVKIIFTTAHERYALEGFKLDAVDYLLKPFGYEEFVVAAQKAKKLIELERKAATGIETNENFLFLKSDYKIRRINYDDILYIEGMKDYVKVVLKGASSSVLTITSLKTIESKLPESRFMRVHRSYIVNLDKVEMVERSRIVFGKTYIPVSDLFKDRFQKFLDENFL